LLLGYIELLLGALSSPAEFDQVIGPFIPDESRRGEASPMMAGLPPRDKHVLLRVVRKRHEERGGCPLRRKKTDSDAESDFFAHHSGPAK
jgi:hypothetical protein